MNLSEKFEKGASSHTYQRIDADYRVNVFLGYNDKGQMSMVITERGRTVPVKSTKLIEVSLKQREDGKLALSFDLLDNAFRSMFLLFCKDMIITCERAGAHVAISIALLRWKYWKEMFGKRKKDILDRMTIKGLVGELIELKDHFIAEYGENRAIASWMGPLLGHKDFEMEKTWYEVKTVAENALQITVSSLEQLESEMDGHLVVIRLEDTNTVNDLSVNLNELVLEIADNIEDPEVLELFRTRLDNMGYVCDEEYNNYNYIYTKTERYAVTADFPRLRRKDLPDAIGNVKYSVLLNGLTSFREE